MSNHNEPTQSGALPSVPLQPVVRPPRFIMPCPFCGKMPKFFGLFDSGETGVWECENNDCYMKARKIGYDASLAQWNDRYDSLANLDKRVSARLNPKVLPLAGLGASREQPVVGLPE